MDPFTQYPDAHIWKALSEVQLKEKIERLPGKMYAELSEFGDSFTTSERQLLCLARALLKNNRVLIIEEPSSDLQQR